jgi:hypothetical protein
VVVKRVRCVVLEQYVCGSGTGSVGGKRRDSVW